MKTRSSAAKRSYEAERDSTASMLAEERLFFKESANEGWSRAKGALTACGLKCPSKINTKSIESLFLSLGGEHSVPGKVFRSMFREDEWNDLLASGSSQEENVAVLRRRRQVRLLESAIKIDAKTLKELRQVLEKLTTSSTCTIVEDGTGGCDEDDSNDEEKPEEKEMQASRKKASSSSSPTTKTKGVQMTRKRVVRQEEEEEDASVSDEETDRRRRVVRKKSVGSWEEVLERMKKSVAVVTLLQKNLSGRAIRVGQLVSPDPRMADWSRGEVLSKDSGRLSVLFSDDDDSAAAPMSAKLGRLVSWWHLCKRSFQIAGLMSYLRQQKGGTLRQRFAETVKDAASYENATRYDRLASMLLEYPLLIYQIEIISLNAWNKWLSGNGLSIPEFWRQKVPPSPTVEEEGDVCSVCGMGDIVAELWFCGSCFVWFHDTCAGYEHNSLVKEVELEPGELHVMDAMCHGCLKKSNTKHCEIVWRMSEVRALGNFLRSPDCAYQLKRVPGDGFCIFGILESFAREELGFAGTSDAFCGVMADHALTSLRTTQDEHGAKSIESVSATALKKLQRTKNGRVKLLKDGLWNDIEVEHLFLGFVQCFKDDVTLYVFKVCDGVLVRSGLSYGTGAKELCVMEWGSLQHYDRLIPRKG